MSNNPSLMILRSHLASLRTARSNIRWFSALAFLGTTLLLLLAGMFVLDFIFQREMLVPQRVVLIAISAGLWLWIFQKFAWPLLRVRESEIDIALLVERQHQIDSDLVAALQFEPDTTGKLGSRQLETAVMDYVAHTGIDVYEGLDRSPVHRNTTFLAIMAGVVIVAGLLFPAHFRAFLTRLTLGHAHYPSATQIVGIAVNGRSIHFTGLQPENVRLAEGRPIDFVIACEGTLPSSGKARVSSQQQSSHTELHFEALSNDERLVRLNEALQMMAEAQTSNEIDVAGQWLDDLGARLQFESPKMWEQIKTEVGRSSAGRRAKVVQKRLPELEEETKKLAADWPRKTDTRKLYVAHLPRLMEPVHYRLTFGDAYTDPAEISMIPLPVVEAKVTPIPPAYAAPVLALATVGRQSAVLVGSEVQVELDCKNSKPLKEAWITIREGAELVRFDLKAASEARLGWKLGTPNTPFNRVTNELRYEIQVTDEDGLHLETPIQGIVRLRLDKAPVATISTIHRVALATAKPKIQYRVGDDFGLKRLAFEVVVKRFEPEKPLGVDPPETPVTEPAVEKIYETTVFNLMPGKTLLNYDELPLVAKSPLDLSQLKLDANHARLDKGDRLEITLIAEDNRGELPGEVFRSEPLILEITDQAGLMDAVSEVNPRAEQQFNDLIQREIGIGESK